MLIPTITDPTFPKGAEVHHNYYNRPVKIAKGFLEGKKPELFAERKTDPLFHIFHAVGSSALTVREGAASALPFFHIGSQKDH